MVACVKLIDAVLDAFRSGEGVPHAVYGSDLHEGQARFTRPMFDRLLTGESGFGDVAVLAIEHGFYRFYRLVP